MDVFNKLRILGSVVLLISRELSYVELSTIPIKKQDMVSVTLYKDIFKILLKINTDIGDNIVVEKLIDTLNKVVDDIENYDIELIIKTIRTDVIEICPNVKSYKELLNSVIADINTDTKEIDVLQKRIISLRNNLNKKLRELEIYKLIKDTNNAIDKTDNISKLSVDVVSKLDKLVTGSSSFKIGIVDEIDIVDDNSMENALTKVKLQSDGSGRLTTGWKELNTMLNGGFIKGETVLTSALQHNFKSGFLRSIFAQVSSLNTPIMTNPSKKPLNVFISFEDNTDVITEFFYKYLYFDKNPGLQTIDISNVDNKEISSFIRNELTKTGYHVKIIRVNPSEWTYRDIFTKVMEYESNGYEVHMVVIDYLSKLPTTGCDNTGPIGTAMRDMLTRCRDYFSSKNILFITTHQLSTEAKQLVRNGIKAEDLVKEIANKGYYEGCKQLDQVVDLELHQHIAKTKEGYFLTVARGKRRYPEIIPDDKRYFKLKFPNNIPCIGSNINTVSVASSIDLADIPF